MDAFRNSPPVSRTLAASVFVVSMLIVCNAIDPRRVIFEWSSVLKSFPELWRPFTSFLITSDLAIIFLPYSIWNFGGALERDIARFSSANFVVYLLFVGSVIICLTTYIFQAVVFTNILVMAICWSYAQNHRGRMVNFFFVNIPVMYLPWAMLLISLIRGGPMAALVEAIGIPAAHLYEFLTNYWPTYGGGRNLLPAPSFLVNYFETTSNVRGVQPDGRRRLNNAAVPGTEAANSAFATGNSWGQRGQGRRLGSD